jgi:hypothetical protein
MALATSVDEAKWVLQSDGRENEVVQSASSYEVVTATWTTLRLEYKYFAITISAAQSYMAANPTLSLTIEPIANFPTACNLIKRTETRTLVSVTGSARPS